MRRLLPLILASVAFAQVTAPKAKTKVEPEYTQEAREARVEGTVLLKIVITPEGRASNVAVTKGLGYGLDENAVQTVMKWEFEPATRDGMPVEVAAVVEMNFRLKER